MGILVKIGFGILNRLLVSLMCICSYLIPWFANRRFLPDMIG